MSNPYLPNWEYIPDGEPRLFGDRVYLYGSHDRAASDSFCDHKLKVWSAPADNLSNWVCHGDAFHTRADRDHKSDTDWTDNYLFAPDVVEKDGKYYLYAYILNSKGCVAVSDRPEGPFELLGTYKFTPPPENADGYCDGGIFVDPGVLVDDDGRVYVFCGFQRSFGVELKNMLEVMDESYVADIIPREKPFEFFEACSPRRVGDTYYLIYSPQRGSCLAYATAERPLGPYTYRGVIVDNGLDYPGGNNHGSICNIDGQWYIFYHRMTNGTVFSRRACAERIEILPDGTIPQVEMTSLGFEKSLSPYQITAAEIACVLNGGCFVTEISLFERVVTGITDGCVMGYKYFEFGEDFSSKTMEFHVNIRGAGAKGYLRVRIDAPDGEEIGVCAVDTRDGAYNCAVKRVTGRHAVYLIAEDCASGWGKEFFKGRSLFGIISFAFVK